MGLTHARFAWDLHPEEKHLAGLLKNVGYRTDGVGIIHETRRPIDYGYEEHHGGRHAKDVADTVIGLLEKKAEDARPFFLYAGTAEPHRLIAENEHGFMGFLGNHLEKDEAAGVQVPEYLMDDSGARAELAEVQGAVREVDTHFGRVLRALDRLGLRENTLVLFTSDHGLALLRAKCTCYDPGLEVPLLLRLPKRAGWHGGRVLSEMLPNIDIMPTLCDLAEANTPEAVHGHSFAPLLDGADYTPNKTVFAEMTHHDYYDPMRAIRTDRYKMILFFSNAPAFMDCSQSWRPRSSTKVPPEPGLAYHPLIELYDLKQDPWEQNNLAGNPEYRTIQRDLLRRLRSHLHETADPILKEAITPPIHHDSLRLLDKA